jgi:hypothetical protein
VPPSSPPPHATTTNMSSSPFFEPRYNAFSPKSSSPPPLFSSDDSRESADLVNYESPRIFKNKRKGAWWDNGDSAQSTPNGKKAKMTRNFDSGVYMMSDCTDSSESLLPPHKSPFGLDETCDTAPEEDSLPTHLGREESEFCRRLYEGLDRNSQAYDFRTCNLQDSDIRQIGQLASVIKDVPDPGNDLPAEGQYRSFVPKLYLNLSDNRLRHLTPSLFNLQNLTTLVLVDNDLEELPAHINQLRALRELNISRNNIRWLPFESLELFQTNMGGKLTILGDSGVPWLMPKTEQKLMCLEVDEIRNQVIVLIHKHGPGLDLALTPQLQDFYQAVAKRPDRDSLVWYIAHLEHMATLLNKLPPSPEQPNRVEQPVFPHHPTLSGISSLEQMHPRYTSRTPVSYFDQSGSLMPGSPAPPTSSASPITETSRGAHGFPPTTFTPPSTSSTHSLLTTSLHTALRYKHHEDLTISDLRDRIGEPIPAVVDALLEQAEENDCAGYGVFRKCNVCHKEYVMRRAEWVEWWCVQGMVHLPFRVIVCGWGCVPEGMRVEQEKMEW